jgi:hypothetical protein
LRSSSRSLYKGSVFSVAEHGYATAEAEGSHAILFSRSRKMKIYKDKNVVISFMGRRHNDLNLVKKLLKRGVEAIQFPGYLKKPDGNLAQNLTIIKNPELLTPLGLYPVRGEAPIPIYPMKALQALGIIGKGATLIFSTQKIIESENPSHEAARQTSLLWAAIQGGAFGGAVAIIPCAKAGALAPPAAHIIVPVCIGSASAMGAFVAVKGLDLSLDIGGCIKEKIKRKLK